LGTVIFSVDVVSYINDLNVNCKQKSTTYDLITAIRALPK